MLHNQKVVEASVKKFLALKDKNCYERGIKQLEERWLQVVCFGLVWLDFMAYQPL